MDYATISDKIFIFTTLTIPSIIGTSLLQFLKRKRYITGSRLAAFISSTSSLPQGRSAHWQYCGSLNAAQNFIDRTGVKLKCTRIACDGLAYVPEQPGYI